jgi:serine/threonine-protein kinase
MRSLGKYELIENMGGGSMGVIYRARDTVLDREVAIKTVSSTALADPELKERFYREARACAKLQHSNIVTVYDFGEHEGTAYIAMELLRGSDLGRVIAEKRPIGLREKVALIAGICDGLHHAHSAGIIHRDIKPSNIFLADDGRARILDFGVARLATSSLTVVGRVLGTPHYMAPEQILGKPCDARSEVFSLAIVAFELFSYSHPFAGSSLPKRIVNEPPHSLQSADPSLPAELDVVLARALEKDPVRRYQTAAELADALRAVPLESSGLSTLGMAVAATTVRGEPEPVPVMASSPGTEVIMSELLAFLPRFDDAVGRGDVAAARATLAEMRRVGGSDARFSVALEQSSRRLAELERSAPPVEPQAEIRPAVMPASPAAQAKASLEPAAPVMAEPPAQPPRLAEIPIRETPSMPAASLDATVMFGGSPTAQTPPQPLVIPSSPPPVPPPPPPQPQAKDAPVPPRVETPRPPPTRPPTVQTAPASPKAPVRFGRKPLHVAILGAVALAVVTSAGVWLTRSPKPQIVSAEATAQVTAAETRIYTAPGSQDVIATVPRGRSLNVVRVPQFAGQQWVEVQQAGAEVTKPGFARTAELGNWFGKTPAAALAVLKAFTPVAEASQDDWLQHSERAKAFLERFGQSPEAADAHLENARSNAALARLADPTQRAGFLEAANQSLAAASARAEMADPVQQIRRELEPLAVPPAPGPTPTPPSTPVPGPVSAPAPALVNPDAVMRSAEALWQSGRYAQAQESLERLLRVRPGYKPAVELLGKVRRAREVEGR